MDRFAARCFLSLVSYCVDTCAIGCSVNGQRHLFLEVLRDDCYGPFVTMSLQIAGPGKAHSWANRCSGTLPLRGTSTRQWQPRTDAQGTCALMRCWCFRNRSKALNQSGPNDPSIFICNTKRVEAMICWLVSCRTFGIVGFIGSIFWGGHIRVYEDSRWGFCLNIMWLD